jgi:polysaccharide biosynthesis/export protein
MRTHFSPNKLYVALLAVLMTVQVSAQADNATASTEMGAKPAAAEAAAATPVAAVDTGNPAASAQAAPEPKQPVHADLRYRIGPGDVLEVRVFDRPNLSRDSIRVDASGLIRMPLIATEIKAACQTEAELSRAIAKAYLEYLKDPQVDVYIKEYNSQPVSLTGAVQKPGSFQLQRQVRLRELLIIAGGPTTSAGQNVQVVNDPAGQICEPDPDERRVLSLDPNLKIYKLDSVMSGDPSMNPFVRPGDFINVPEANQAYVVGNVYKPSPVPLAGKLTVTRAVAMAGGTLPYSKGNVRLLRLTPDQNGTREIFLNLKEMQRNVQEDVALQAGDIVEVEVSQSKSTAKLLLSSFANAVANAAVWYPLTTIR